MCVCVCVFLGAWQHGNSINFHLVLRVRKNTLPLQFSPFASENECKSERKSPKKRKGAPSISHTHTEKVRSKKDNKKLIATNSCTISRVRLETRVEGPRQKWVLKGDQTPHGTRVPSFFDSFQRLAFFATLPVFLLIFGPAM